MNDELGAVLLCTILVFGIGFFVYSGSNMSISGHVVYNPELQTNQTNVSRAEVILALEESEQIMSKFIESNFSIIYINDSILEAKRVLQLIDYAEIVRGNVNASDSEKQEARDALRLITWKNMNYSDVLVYTETIKEREKQAYEISDLISIYESQIKDAKLNLDVGEAEFLLSQAEDAFREDRYEEAFSLLEQTQASIENIVRQGAVANSVASGIKNFFLRYWVYIVIGLILLGVLSLLFYHKLRIKHLSKKIKKLKAEQIVVTDLMKKAQEERFNQNKISGLVYNIRMKNYNDRISDIKEQLPVYEKILAELSRKQKSKH